MANRLWPNQVQPFLDLANPTVAPYAGDGEVKLRMTAKAESVAAANELIAPVAAKLRQIGGSDCYGQDDDTLASVVGQLLAARAQTLSVAESCTGGGLGQLLTAVSGSSNYFWGGVISYDNRVKQSLLGVEASVLASCGAVSEQVAIAMAGGVRDRLGTDWGVSITGIAGPGGGSAEKPVGLVYIGLSSEAGTHSEKYLFGADRRRDSNSPAECSDRTKPVALSTNCRSKRLLRSVQTEDQILSRSGLLTSKEIREIR